jgi:hypothetical protein
METAYRQTLALSADSPEQLRPCDVDRVMDDAAQRGFADGFRAWLLAQPLMPRTAMLLDQYA